MLDDDTYINMVTLMMLLPHFMDDVAHPLEGIGLDDECSRLGDEH